MNYLILQEELSLPIIGSFLQVERIVGNTSSNIIQSIDLWSGLSNDLNLPEYRLRKKAKLTDMLSCTSLYTNNALLISSRTRGLFNDFICDLDYSEFEANILDHKGNIHKYSYIYLNQINNDYIDFNMSRFIEFDSLDIPLKGRLVKFSNAIEYTNYFKNLKRTDFLKHYQMYLKENINKHFFRVRGSFSGLFASDEVKETVTNHQLTGFQFISLDKLTERASVIDGTMEIIDI